MAKLQMYDIVSYNGKKASIAKVDSNGPATYYIEFIDDASGWHRDGNGIPPEYEKVGKNEYWSVKEDELLLLEKRNGIPYKQSSSQETQSTNMFKKGDYIVLLRELGQIALKNFCFKTREEGRTLLPEYDSFGNYKNQCNFNNIYKEDWRYATPEERAEYDRIGKPYDVTTLSKKKEEKTNLIGRYLKALVDNAVSIPIKKGEYLYITGEYTCRDSHGNSWGYGNNEGAWSVNKNLELMPIGWTPSTQENTLRGEIGKWYEAKCTDVGDVYEIQLKTIIRNVTYPFEGIYRKKGEKKDFSSYTGCFLTLIREIPCPLKEDGQTVNTYGLVLGDELKKDDLNEWCKRGKNWWSNEKEGWKIAHGPFSADRIISSFVKKDGVDAFLVSGTATVHMRCEGFKEFCAQRRGEKAKKIPSESKFFKETPSKTLLEEAELRYPPGTECDNTNLGKNCKFMISSYPKFYRNQSSGSIISQNNALGGEYTVYADGKWADIVSKPEPKEKLKDEYLEYGKVKNFDYDYWRENIRVVKRDGKIDPLSPEDAPSFSKKGSRKSAIRVELQRQVEYTPPSKKSVKRIVTV